MDTILKNQLLVYLGELMYQEEHEHDWMKKDELKKKINAAYILLDIDIHISIIKHLWKP